jgi:peptidoglycan/LPS O-acetylase OafA/YrhL
VISKTRSGYIDQWRGISVLMVVANHLIIYRFGPWLSAPHSRLVHGFTWRISTWGANAGMIGVDVFFVISGYLITKLLLEEETSRGRISLAAFYIRRTMRIWPAMITYVAAVIAFRVVSLRQALPALTFACNTSWVECPHPLSQFWSLAVEEQFYLVWPGLLILSGRFRLQLAAAITIVSAALALLPFVRVHGWINNPFDVYCLSAGVLFALSADVRRIAAARVPTWVLGAALLVVIPFAITRWNALWPLALLVLPPLIVATVIARDGKVYEPLRQVGLVSYSLYLWQALATLPSYSSGTIALLSLLAFPAAWLSFRFVERPLIRIGHRWSARLLMKEAARIPSDSVAVSQSASSGS